jgi:hypothetical protein
MDLLDLELARHYYVGKRLSVRPFFGARAAWIRQKVEIDYLFVTRPLLPRKNVFIDQLARSWAVGPRVGLSTKWGLGKGLRMYGDGSVDILFTEYTRLEFFQQATNARGVLIAGSPFAVRQKNDQHLRAHLDLELGFGWGVYFTDHRWHVDFSAGYDFQIFLGQNMFRSFVNDQFFGKAFTPNGNLYIHGLTATARFDF